jgi:hypothetical protein
MCHHFELVQKIFSQNRNRNGKIPSALKRLFSFIGSYGGDPPRSAISAYMKLSLKLNFKQKFSTKLVSMGQCSLKFIGDHYRSPSCHMEIYERGKLWEDSRVQRFPIFIIKENVMERNENGTESLVYKKKVISTHLPLPGTISAYKNEWNDLFIVEKLCPHSGL